MKKAFFLIVYLVVVSGIFPKAELFCADRLLTDNTGEQTGYSTVYSSKIRENLLVISTGTSTNPGFAVDWCNPFYPDSSDPAKNQIKFPYYLSLDEFVSMKVYTLRGTLVKEIIKKGDGMKLAGPHDPVSWDGKNEAGETVASGIYLVVFEMGDPIVDSQVEKVMVIRE